MASASFSLSSTPVLPRSKSVAGFNNLKSSSVVKLRFSSPMPLNLQTCRTLKVSCQAKPETVEKVIMVVTEQLAASPDKVKPQTSFAELGADSLDQVEIVMRLEEEFGITMDEDKAEAIVTVQDAADLIEKVARDGSKTKPR